MSRSYVSIMGNKPSFMGINGIMKVKHRQYIAWNGMDYEITIPLCYFLFPPHIRSRHNHPSTTQSRVPTWVTCAWDHISLRSFGRIPQWGIALSAYLSSDLSILILSLSIRFPEWTDTGMTPLGIQAPWLPCFPPLLYLVYKYKDFSSTI